MFSCSMYMDTPVGCIACMKFKFHPLYMQLPNICHFQDLVYTIIIQRVQPSHNTNTEDIDIVIGPKTVRGQTVVHEVINSSLVVNAVYSVLVNIVTVTGNVSSNTTFSKQSVVCNENT